MAEFTSPAYLLKVARRGTAVFIAMGIGIALAFGLVWSTRASRPASQMTAVELAFAICTLIWAGLLMDNLAEVAKLKREAQP